MSTTAGYMLDAISGGDGLAVRGLLDLLEEAGDERLTQVKKAWQSKLREFAVEVGVLWTEYAPKFLYPDWRDAISPTMNTLPYLGRYSASPRCTRAHRTEIGSLIEGFARVLYGMGCCQNIEWITEEGRLYLRFTFQFREDGWWCVLAPEELTWPYSLAVQPGPPLSSYDSSEPPVRLSPRRYTQAKALVQYVIASGESYLAHWHDKGSTG